jgi:hypothetical protein
MLHVAWWPMGLHGAGVGHCIACICHKNFGSSSLLADCPCTSTESFGAASLAAFLASLAAYTHTLMQVMDNMAS